MHVGGGLDLAPWTKLFTCTCKLCCVNTYGITCLLRTTLSCVPTNCPKEVLRSLVSDRGCVLGVFYAGPYTSDISVALSQPRKDEWGLSTSSGSSPSVMHMENFTRCINCLDWVKALHMLALSPQSYRSFCELSQDRPRLLNIRM